MSRRPRGLTLVESVMAGSLMFFLFVVCGMLAGGTRQLTVAAGHSLASEILARQMDAIRLMAFDEVQPGTFTGGAAVAGFPPGPYPGESRLAPTSGEDSPRRYAIQVECVSGTDRTGAALPNLKVVRVSVLWREGHVERSVSGYTTVYDERSFL